MKGPIVSIDVSKGKSDYQAFKEMNVKYTGSRSIKHTKEGFDEIVSLVREMEKKRKQKYVLFMRQQEFTIVSLRKCLKTTISSSLLLIHYYQPKQERMIH